MKILKEPLVMFLETFFITALLGIAGLKAYEKSYEVTDRYLEEKNAEEDYQKIMKSLKGITFDSDLTTRIYNATGVNVENDAFYQKVNNMLGSIQSLEELEIFALNYVKEYVVRNWEQYSDRSCIGFEQEKILYDGENVSCDPDVMCALGNILMSLENIDSMNEEDKVVTLQLLKEQIIATEVYKVEKSEDKSHQLALTLKN